jgi:drug/metabolite transporter (DMT)-like permease
VTSSVGLPWRGVACGLAAAALFGLSAPLAKLLLAGAGPLVVAGLLYLGAGLGLVAYGVVGGTRRRPAEAPIRRSDLPLLAGIIAAGGIVGPVLMLVGLRRVSGTVGSLLLNLEAPFTILLAVLLFGEHLGRRPAFAALVIVLGAVLLGYQPGEAGADWLGVVAIAGACASWAVDNNLTQRVSLRDPVAVVRIKALGAGICTLAVAMALGQPVPPPRVVLPVLVVGFVSYGVSIVLDVYALRALGAAREAALFATAPFVGALGSIPILAERLGPADLAGMGVMATGVVLLLTARHHAHVHRHEALEHEHAHVHDEHHRHEHDGPVTEPHSHPHRHEPITHSHPHVSDLHHRHRH